MSWNNHPVLLAATLALAPLAGGCGSSPQTPCNAAHFSASTYSQVGSWVAGNNTMTVTVNGNLCDPSHQYPNQPCTSVTVCSPSNPSNCQTVNNILLDTGSYGLRIFASSLTVPLTPITHDGQNLAECVQFGDGSSEWGQVQYAYIQLGNEPKIAAPILVINSSYATPPPACSSSQSYPDINESQTGFNGILGVGLWTQDCGSDCVSDAKNGQYFTCNGTDCSCGATADLGAQVQNPVALLPTDNNGVGLTLPSIASAGSPSLTGSLTLGIQTQSNNHPSGTTLYTVNGSGQMTTTFTPYSSSAIPSFLDSGSNGLFFPNPTDTPLPDCGGNYAGAFCPNTTQIYTATNTSHTGGRSGSVSFRVGKASTLLSQCNAAGGGGGGGAGNCVFDHYGANELYGTSGSSSASFDWGLPFFINRTTWVGIDGKTSILGTGPYWAY